MLPVSLSQSKEEAAKSQAKFIMLRSLESQLPKPLFEQVLYTVQQNIEFPQRFDWTGELRPQNFEELKTNFSHIDQNFLPQLLISVGNGLGSSSENLSANKQCLKTADQRARVVAGSHSNILLGSKQRSDKNANFYQKSSLRDFEVARFDRMKTVFGHCLLDSGDLTPIYCVTFDRTGKFIITGADDGQIKIWDKDTLTLQVTLHGHQDNITDIDVSHCNKYLVSASEDSVIFVWDLHKGLMIEELTGHSKRVNSVKFFKFKIKPVSETSTQTKDSIQLLVACSEDGIIQLFDFSESDKEESGQGSKKNSQEDTVTRRTTRKLEQLQQLNQQNNSQKNKERFVVQLLSDDFRPGARFNKKIISVSMNSAGLLAAGTHSGEIFLWKVDFIAIKKQQTQKVSQWIGSFKKHTSIIRFLEFSPDGMHLFSGSGDGSGKIWNMDTEKPKKQDSQNSQKPFELSEDRLVAHMEEKQKKNPQVDTLTWSCNGRYAVVSISFPNDQQKENAISTIKVWDSYTNEITNDLYQENNIMNQAQFSFVVICHPLYEEILLTGSQGGQIFLWNLATKKIIKKFIEYGVYSIEKYTYNDPYEGKFSPDGSCFVVGTQDGTISLFSNQGAAHKYEATRIEQFFQLDGSRGEVNVYEKRNIEPQICSSSLIPYEIQPPNKYIGQFSKKSTLTNEEYERQLLVRKELVKEEDKFILQQLEDAQRDGMFDNDQHIQEVPMQILEESDEEVVPIRGNRRPRLNSQLSDHQQRLQQNRQNNQGSRRRLLQQQDQLIESQPPRSLYHDPENSLYDRDSDGDFDESDLADLESEEESEDASEEVYDYEPRRENYYSRLQTRRQEEAQRNESVNNQIEDNAQESSRHLRLLRRQTRQEGIEVEQENKIQTRKKPRRQIIDDSEESEQEMSDDEEEKQPQKQKTRSGRLVKNQSSKNSNCLKSSDDESASSYYDEEDETFNHDKNRKKKSKGKNNSTRDTRQTRNQNKSKQIVYKDDDSEMSNEEMKGEDDEDIKQIYQEEQKKEKSKKRRVIDSEDNEEEEVIQIDTKSNNKQPADEDFEFIEEAEAIEQSDNLEAICEICKRIDQPLIGPFIRTSGPKKQDKYFFHKDCIEISLYSYYDKQKGKWLGIGKALSVLSKNPRKFICQRCTKPGATICCHKCKKFYHGHLCSSLYLIWSGAIDYECFECRNIEHYYRFKESSCIMPEAEYQDICKKMSREHLLCSKLQSKQYIPQINDLVYYFFQGHEKFILTYNCFFYCGDSDKLSFSYPWKQHQLNDEPLLCKIINLYHQFPSRKAINLIKRFGRSSQDVVQKPQIMSILELQMCKDLNKKFEIVMFSNDLPDFIVQKEIYEKSLFEFNELYNHQNYKEQSFETYIPSFPKIKLIDIQAIEPTLYPFSQWETVIFQKSQLQQPRDRLGRRSQRRLEEEKNDEMPGRMNFWEIKLTNEERSEDKSCFDEIEIERLMNVIQDFIEKKKDSIEPFLHRVHESIAKDYKCHIASEMYLNLVVERLLSKYYRSQEQLFCDLDLISHNASLYNGEDSVLTKSAKKLMESLRCELKRFMNSGGDRKQPKEDLNQFNFSYKAPGKLTVPLKSEKLASSMEQFLKNSEEQSNLNNMGRQRTIVEETKTKEKIPKSEQSLPKASFEDENSNELTIQVEDFQENFNSDPPIPNSNTMIQIKTSEVRRSGRLQKTSKPQNPMNGEEVELKMSSVKNENMLGKRTNRKGKVNEMADLDFDWDEDCQQVKESEEMIRPSRMAKRVRQ